MVLLQKLYSKKLQPGLQRRNYDDHTDQLHDDEDTNPVRNCCGFQIRNDDLQIEDQPVPLFALAEDHSDRAVVECQEVGVQQAAHCALHVVEVSFGHCRCQSSRYRQCDKKRVKLEEQGDLWVGVGWREGKKFAELEDSVKGFGHGVGGVRFERLELEKLCKSRLEL